MKVLAVAALMSVSLLTGCEMREPPADEQVNASHGDDPAELVTEVDIEGWRPFDADVARGLTFDFPDGSRGGRGSIQGLHPSQSSSGWEPPEEVILRCGGTIIPQAAQPTHHHYVTVRSGPRDLEIVRCVQRDSSRHFSVEQTPAHPAAPSE
jgi:hypothetical protein